MIGHLLEVRIPTESQTAQTRTLSLYSTRLSFKVSNKSPESSDHWLTLKEQKQNITFIRERFGKWMSENIFDEHYIRKEATNEIPFKFSHLNKTPLKNNFFFYFYGVISNVIIEQCTLPMHVVQLLKVTLFSSKYKIIFAIRVAFVFYTSIIKKEKRNSTDFKRVKTKMGIFYFLYQKSKEKEPLSPCIGTWIVATSWLFRVLCL